jgi:hypothetical protein
MPRKPHSEKSRDLISRGMKENKRWRDKLLKKAGAKTPKKTTI